MPRVRTLLPVLLGIVALIVAGCASQDSGSSGAQSGGNSGNATVAFATPAANAKVTSPVKVEFTVQGAEIGQPETGKMHFHVYVDQSSDYKILYAPSGQIDVPAGQHTLKVVLAQPNHTETSATATQQIDVTGTAGGAAPTTTAAGGGGYGYP
ncbi:MAG TPA: hypothetical protein VE776_07875 [Actinomycetota bacterium]|jgi:type IV pilus biogenesis protein CpaD/CtpE|nr:hypothetical protein [Actinomycetota bacterium]